MQHWISNTQLDMMLLLSKTKHSCCVCCGIIIKKEENLPDDVTISSSTVIGQSLGNTSSQMLGHVQIEELESIQSVASGQVISVCTPIL